MKKIPTTCVYCGCGCGLILHVEGDRIVGASPMPRHPMSKGRLCIKGWLAGDFVGHPDRLKGPLIRKDETLLPASWEEALTMTATRLLQIRRDHGPSSVAVLTSAKGTNEENYLLMKLARAGLQTNNVDHVARLCHAPTVAGLGYALGSGAATNPLTDLADAGAVLVVGSNTTEQHPLASSYILQSVAKGGRLVVADPRQTQLAEIAHVHLRPRPGTDIAMINGLLNVIIDEGLTDEAFISERTEGFDAVKRAVSGYSPDLVQEVSGIPADDLREAARIYAAAPAAAIVYAMGITQHTTGTDNVQALANLSLATGNVGRKGTGIYPLRGHQNVQGACDMGALPTVYSGYQKVEDAKEKFEEAWGTHLPAEPGITAVEMMEAAEGGEIRGMLIVGENPLMSYPDSKRVGAALDRLEFLAVSDIFPTQTTDKADVVLPAACFAEKDGTFTSTERRVQMVRRAIPPPGKALPEWEFVSDLLGRMGVPANYSSPGDVMDEIASVTPIYGGIRRDRLGISGLQWPCPEPGHPGTPILHSEGFSIGRARFRAVEHIDPPETPDEVYPFILTTGRSLYQFHTGTMTRRTSLLDRETPGGWVELSPADASRLGLREGQKALVETRHGSIEADVRITPGIPQRTVFVPFHFEESPANALTGFSLDPQSKIPEMKALTARVRRAI